LREPARCVTEEAARSTCRINHALSRARINHVDEQADCALRREELSLGASGRRSDKRFISIADGICEWISEVDLPKLLIHEAETWRIEKDLGVVIEDIGELALELRKLRSIELRERQGILRYGLAFVNSQRAAEDATDDLFNQSLIARRADQSTGEKIPDARVRFASAGRTRARPNPHSTPADIAGTTVR
jgi:hypothetical protein